MQKEKKTIDKEKWEKYLSEKFTQEEGRLCKVIIHDFQSLGKDENGDEKIYYEGVIHRPA